MVTQVDPQQSSLLGKPQSPLLLRVEGTERDGQTVRLERAKCVIGSAASCSLRLIAAGVRKQHCVIWRGKAGMFLQRVDGEVLINGQSVTESRLVAGDLITIGAVSLRIDPESAAAAAPQNERRLQSLEQRLGEIRGRNRRRVHRLVEALRQSSSPAAAPQEMTKTQPVEVRVDPSHAEQLAENERLRDELQQTRDQSDSQIAELTRRLESLELEYRELETSGDAASAEAQEARDKAHRDVADANERLQVLSRGWSEREEELTRRIEELENAPPALPEPELRESPKISAPATSLDRSPVEEEPAESYQAQYEPEEEYEEEPAEDAASQPATSQTSVADVLAKFGYDPHAAEDEEEEYEPTPPPQPVSYEEEAPAARDEDDVSIEEYMSSLMNRVRGREAEKAADKAKPEPAKKPEPPKPRVEQAPFSPGEFMPSRKAPEQTSDLRALRDLANQSARSAIDVHTLKRWNNLYVTKLIVSIVAFVTAICLLFEMKGIMSLQFMGAMMGITISIFWALQAVVVYNQLRSARKVANAEELKLLDEANAFGFDMPELERDKPDSSS